MDIIDFVCYVESDVDKIYPRLQPPKKNYVYIHKDSKGNIFYVGKGKKRRGWCAKLRSDAWKNIAFSGFTLEILQDNLTKTEATELEYRLIKLLMQRHPLVNQILGKKYEYIKVR